MTSCPSTVLHKLKNFCDDLPIILDSLGLRPFFLRQFSLSSIRLSMLIPFEFSIVGGLL